MHGDLNLSSFDNFHFELTNIKKYLKEKNNDANDKFLNFEKFV